MNKINAIQKSPEIQKMFAAQARLYTEAKRWMMARMWLSLLVGLFPFVAYFSSEISALEWTASLPAILISIAFPFLFRNFENQKIATAASIQQKIDLTLYEIPWDKEKDGLPPLDQIIIAANERYNEDRERFNPWYEGVSDEWALEKAALYCQNQNLWWDAQQRVFFQNLFLWLGLVTLLFPIFLAAIQSGMLLTEYLAKYLLPTLPLLQLSFEKWSEQKSIETRQLPLAAEIAALKNDALPVSKQMIRKFQDSIFEIRKSTALVPDRIYKIMRSNLSNIITRNS